MKTTCKSLALGLTAALALVGCAKTPIHVTRIPGQDPAALVGANDSKIGSGESVPSTEGLKTSDIDANGGIAATDPSQYDTWPADAAALAAYMVHFDYDSSTIKASEESKVTAVADHLKGPAAMALRVDGHCDERGTEEYNRSLGDRRANALREKLATMGVDPKKIVTRSFGEDKPLDPGHNEAAYSKNRRGEFILLTPPTNTQLSQLNKDQAK